MPKLAVTAIVDPPVGTGELEKLEEITQIIKDILYQ